MNEVIQIEQDIIHAINVFEFLELLKSVSNLVNDGLIKTKYEYTELMKKLEAAREEQAKQAQIAQQAQTMRNMATANKEGATANAIQQM